MIFLSFNFLRPQNFLVQKHRGKHLKFSIQKGYRIKKIFEMLCGRQDSMC